jgi:glycosyltransferase involved in cell wall biosynthesis
VTNLLWHRLRLPLPAQVVAGRFDLFHSPDFTAPPTAGRPAIVTIHDLAFIRHPECAYPTLRAYLEAVVPRQARRAAHIVVISENSRRDVVEILGVPRERVTVAYPGVTAVFTEQVRPETAREVVRRAGIDGPFVLSVSTLEPRKNYVRLLDAFDLLRARGLEHRLVIAGARGWMDEPIFRRLRERRLEDRVTILRPDDELLRALYATADAYVCASLYEGFGIPVAEALAAGLPVASTFAASLPEVVGDAGILFDPEDVDAMAEAIERLLSDGELAASLRTRGPLQARRFTWEACAEAIVSVYQEVARA